MRIFNPIEEKDEVDDDSALFINYAQLIICIISAWLGLKSMFLAHGHVIYRWKRIFNLIEENDEVDDDSALFINYAHLIICIISA